MTDEQEAEGYLVSVSDLMVGLLFVFILILLAFALQLREAERAAEQERLELISRRESVEAERNALKEERNELTARRSQLENELANLSYRLQELEQDRRRQEEELGLARETQQAQLAAVRSNVRMELSDEVQRIEDALRRAQSMREHLLRTIESSLRARGVPVAVDLASGVLRLADRILFASGRSDLPLTGPARDALRNVAEVFSETLPCFTASGVTNPRCPTGSAAIIDAVFIEGHWTYPAFVERHWVR